MLERRIPRVLRTAARGLGGNGRAKRQSLAGETAAEKGVLPDIAQEERVLRAWRVKEEARGRALERALQEPIPK